MCYLQLPFSIKRLPAVLQTLNKIVRSQKPNRTQDISFLFFFLPNHVEVIKNVHIIRLTCDLQVKSTLGSSQLKGSHLLEGMSAGRKSLGVAAGHLVLPDSSHPPGLTRFTSIGACRLVPHCPHHCTPAEVACKDSLLCHFAFLSSFFFLCRFDGLSFRRISGSFCIKSIWNYLTNHFIKIFGMCTSNWSCISYFTLKNNVNDSVAVTSSPVTKYASLFSLTDQTHCSTCICSI